MEPSSRFYEYLKKFIPLSPEEYNRYLAPVIHIREFQKKELLTVAGEVEEYFNFITKGLIRKYYLREKEEVNTQISYEGHIIHSQESYHSRQPSEYFVEAIEPSTVVSIKYNDLESAYNQSHKIERLGRLVITFSMVIKDRWQMQMLKMNPRERFLYFVTNHPELIQKVPQKYLASYLNIKPETFSRFKHLLKNISREPVV
jgi:CRP-like cAMP-binding protein